MCSSVSFLTLDTVTLRILDRLPADFSRWFRFISKFILALILEGDRLGTCSDL